MQLISDTILNALKTQSTNGLGELSYTDFVYKLYGNPRSDRQLRAYRLLRYALEQWNNTSGAENPMTADQFAVVIRKLTRINTDILSKEYVPCEANESVTYLLY